MMCIYMQTTYQYSYIHTIRLKYVFLRNLCSSLQYTFATDIDCLPSKLTKEWSLPGPPSALWDSQLTATGHMVPCYSDRKQGLRQFHQALGSPFPSASTNSILGIHLTCLVSLPPIFIKGSISSSCAFTQLLNDAMYSHGFLLVTKQQPGSLNTRSQSSLWTLNRIFFGGVLQGIQAAVTTGQLGMSNKLLIFLLSETNLQCFNQTCPCIHSVLGGDIIIYLVT